MGLDRHARRNWAIIELALAQFAFAQFAFAQHTPAIRVDVDLVTVPCSVIDRNGALVSDLTRDDFLITDNGAPQQIKQLWRDIDLPLTVGLIVDVSGSQMGLVEKHKQTIAEFLTRVLGERDHAFLVTVGPDVRLLTDLTNSIDELRRGVDAIDSRQRAGEQLGEPCRAHGRRRWRGCGGTALWNGVWASARLKMKSIEGRKAIVIVSDGMDTGSTHSLIEAIEAAQGADTVVYAIKYVSPMIALSPAMALVAVLSHGMKRLAEETGGEQFPAPSGGPGDIFTRIEQELRSQYVLAFSPSEGGHDGKYHRLTIKLKRPELRRGRARATTRPSLRHERKNSKPPASFPKRIVSSNANASNCRGRVWKHLCKCNGEDPFMKRTFLTLVLAAATLPFVSAQTGTGQTSSPSQTAPSSGTSGQTTPAPGTGHNQPRHRGAANQNSTAHQNGTADRTNG